MNNLQLGDQLFLLLLTLVVVGGPIAYLIWRRERKFRKDSNAQMAREFAKDILVQSGYPERQRWITDEEIEFLYLISGPATDPNWHSIWAYIRVTRESMSARIEYAEGISSESLLFAEAVETQLKEAKINARLATGPSPQPDLSHTGVREFNGGPSTR